MIWCYKIMFGIVDINVDDFFEHSPATTTRGHDHKLYKRYSRKNARHLFFCERVVGCGTGLQVAIAICGCQPISHNIETSSIESAMAENVGIAVEISLLSHSVPEI